MPKHSETRILPYSIPQLYALVADVPSYPEFLPGVVAARVLGGTPEPNSAGPILAELAVRYGPYRASYVSRVHFTPPKAGRAAVRAELERGPFTHLLNEWRFEEAEGGTNVHFTVDFAFTSPMMEAMISKVFDQVAGKMSEAFEERAKRLYGG